MGVLAAAVVACSPEGDLGSVAERSAPDATATAPRTPSVDAGSPSGAAGGQSARVVDVIDGDTIRVRLGGRDVTLRYIGIDAPETRHPTVAVECYGREASAANERLVGGKTVLLEKDVSETDDFGRLLRYVHVDGRMVNELLVREGYAVLSTFPPDVRHVERLRAAQQEARDAERGLWAACGGADTPATTAPPLQPSGRCDPAYPDGCIPPPPPDLDCADVPHRRFAVRPPDPHRFDADHDGVGCE